MDRAARARVGGDGEREAHLEHATIGPVIVMGVSGSGKSTVGRLIAAGARTSYIEGDDLHPARNIEKMEAGIPLEDDDRWPWLEEVGRVLETCVGRHGAVAACSALKRSYRDVLRYTVGPGLRFVHLTGPRAVLEGRMCARRGHFMPATMLDSQLATLEPPQREDARDFSIEDDPAIVAEAALAWLRRENA